MKGPTSPPSRRIFGRVSIAAGNVLQLAGLAAACFALTAARAAQSTIVAIVAVLVAWVLLYFSCHAIAHCLVGRLLGIRFAFYTVGGTGNPEGWPPGPRWLFERLPFFGVQTERASMQSASPMARAIMWSAGVTCSAVVPVLGVLWACHGRIPGSKLFLLFSVGWSVGTLASNWTSRTGDFSKARRALASP
jgi:hypothetical protein